MTSVIASAALSRRRLPLSVALGILVVDQLTKWWALVGLDDGRIIEIVWTLRLRLVFNEGMSFSLGQGLGWLVGLVGIVIVAVLVAWSGRLEPTPQRLAAGAVIGGAVGNLVDRVFRADDGPLSGAVVDFLDLQWWPVFNVADMALVVGVITLVGLLAVEDARLARDDVRTEAAAVGEPDDTTAGPDEAEPAGGPEQRADGERGASG